MTHFVDGTPKLKTKLKYSEPEKIILVQVARDWLPDTRVLDMMAGNLGNVSIFVEGHYSAASLLHYCHRMGDRCYHLETLLPILTEIHKWSLHSEISSTLLDIYDTRWLPVTTPVPISSNQVFSVHNQIELLVAKLCLRDKRHNQYYELHHSSDMDDFELCVCLFLKII